MKYKNLKYYINIVIYISFLFSTTVFAQIQMQNRAYEYATTGKYLEAKQAIDFAAKNDITSKDPKTWYLRGFIYKELYNDAASEGNLSEARELRKSSILSLKNSIELDTQQEYTEDCTDILNYLYGTILTTEGVANLERQNFREAIKNIRTYVDDWGKKGANYGDAVYYLGYAYSALRNVDSALYYYQQALDLDYDEPLIYYNLAYIYENKQMKDKSIGIIRQGIKRYPNNENLIIANINVLLSFNELEEAEPVIKYYVDNFNETADVMIVAATVYEKLESKFPNLQDKYFNYRVNALNRALQLEPNNFTANYNLGIAYFNRGVDIVLAAEYTYDLQEVMNMLDEVADLFTTAKPYVEKAHRLNEENVQVLKALEGIYYQLGQKDELENVKKKLNSIQDN